jgi:periplasmic protein TonB
MNKFLRFICFITIFVLFLRTCSRHFRPSGNVYSLGIEEPEDNIIFEFLAEKATYPGGDEALLADLGKIHYPEMEKENNIQGTVFVSFVVEKDGQVTNAEVIRGVPGGTNLSEEAIKVIKALKNFIPAKQNGKAVRFKMSVPVKFTLK